MEGGFGTNARKSTVKSIQYVTLTLASGNTSDTATISAVDTAKTTLHMLGFSTSYTGGGSPTPASTFPRITLTNSTTITATRNTAPANDTVISICVEEKY